MHKIVVLYGAPADPTSFEQYYRSVHLPLVEKMPGIQDIQFAIGLTDAPYFAYFEANFASTEAFGAAMSSQAGADVQEDVGNFASGGATVLTFPIETRA